MSNAATAQSFNETIGVAPSEMTASNQPPPDLDAPALDETTPTVEAKPAAKPKAPPPKPEEPSTGKLAMRVRAREKRVREEAARIEAEKRSIETHGRTVDLAHQVVDLAQKDPIALLKNLGWSNDRIAERIMNDGRPGPQELRERQEERIARLEQRLEREQQETERAKVQTTVSKAQQDFVALARGGENKWPLAGRYSDAKLIAMGDRIADEHLSKGQRLTYAKVLDKIEEELGEIASLATKAKTGKGGKTTAANPDDVLSLSESQLADLTKAALDELTEAPEVDDGWDPLTATPEEQEKKLAEAIAAATGKPRKRRLDGTTRSR